jgi:3-oxoacyl-[acyl-carrier-protein] synthase II
MTRRVVVSGIGMVTPLGLTREPTWYGLMEGRSGIGPITRFDAAGLGSRIAGEVGGFAAGQWMSERDVQTTDRFIHLAVAAAAEAVADAGLETNALGERAGCYMGVGFGGAPMIEHTVEMVLRRGPRFGVRPAFIPAVLPNMAAAAVAVRFGITGPVLCHATACASGAHAIGEAGRAIDRGDADVMLAGGSESAINLISVGGFDSLRALSRRNADPQAASRPFDGDRDGFVIAEGAAVLVLEDHARARARGAPIYAELAGFGLSSDAAHPTAPAAGGTGAGQAMRMALRDARLAPDGIQYINAHGTGTPLNDATETDAIRRTFGSVADRLMVSSTKSMLGHMLGAAGAVEAAVCALVCARGRVPPTVNQSSPDPACDLDYVPNCGRDVPVQAAMSNSFGFGGVNAALILTRCT